MKILHITSPEALDARVAEVVRLKINHTEVTAQMDAEIAAVQKRYARPLRLLVEEVDEAEGLVKDYCLAHRTALFIEKKSRESAAAVIGFELTPPRVETANKKIKWKDVVARLVRMNWGQAYVRTAEPKPDKEALLADREKLTVEQITAAGIEFVQDEQFFIRPKCASAEDSVKQAA